MKDFLNLLDSEMRHDEATDHASSIVLFKCEILCTIEEEGKIPELTGPFSTLQRNKSGMIGLRSAGRQNKPSPLLTRPTCTTKSSARDQSTRAAKLQYVSQGARSSANPHCRPDGVQGRSLFVRSCGTCEYVAPYPARILT